MDKYFVCLANSYKHDNRCLAGVLVEKSLNEYTIVTDYWNHPKWFRPINESTIAGAIPNEEAEDIELLDVIKAENVSACPNGAQQENYYYSRLLKVGELKLTDKLLEQLSKTSRKVIFGNKNAYVTHDYYENLEYSIIMIEAYNVCCYLKEREEKLPQPRMKFSYKDNKYDFPITDPDFRHIVECDLEEANGAERYFLTLSLGTICDDKHFKLVAGVVKKGIKTHNISSIIGINESSKISFSMYRKGYSIEEIATEREMTIGTIANHLIPFVKNGEIDIHELVESDDIKRIVNFQKSHPYEDKLKPYFEAFDGEISYDTIRFVLATIK